MMLTRTACFAPRCIGRYPKAISVARRRQFAFPLTRDNARSIDTARPTSSAGAQASFSHHSDRTIAVEGVWVIDRPRCRGGTLQDALSSLSYPSGFQCRFYSRGTGPKAPRFSDRQMLEENVEAAYNHIDILSPRDVAAFWTVVSKIQKQHRRRMTKKQGGIGDRNHNIGQKMSRQFDAILCHTIEEMRSYGYRELAQTTLAFAKIVKDVGGEGKKPNDSPRQILHDFMVGTDSENKHLIFQEVTLASIPILEESDPRSLSNFIYAFGLAGHNHKFEDGSTFFDMLALVAIPKLKRFNSQDLSNMLLAYAHMRVSNSKLFEKAGDVIERGSLETFDEQAIANIVWAYAKVNEPHPKLFKTVADHIMALDNLGGFKPQELSNTVWAYATAKESHPKLFEKVANHILVLNDLGDFKSQELSNIAWAYAKANEQHPKLFKKVADHIIALDNLGGFIPQDYSNLVWAYATAKEPHPLLFEKVVDHIMALKDLKGFQPQNLSNIVWAFATLNESHPKLFEKVADHVMALHNLGCFNPQALSNIVWGFATLNEPHPKLFKKVADHIVALKDLEGFIHQNLANIAWAFATAKESHPDLFHKLAKAAIQKKAEFNSQSIANFLWAHAANGNLDENLFQTLAPIAEASIAKCSGQGLANIAWAFAVVNVSVSSLFGDIFVKACNDKEQDFTVEGLGQLHQWQIWQEELKSHVTLHPSLCEKCHEAFVSREPTPSALQDDVISELKAMGRQPEEEVLTKRGYRLDAVVEVDGNRIGVEVDGPSHFLGRRLTGSTMLKHRQVANIEGMPVVSVPYWEWNKLRKDSDKKQKYLRSLLGLSQS